MTALKAWYKDEHGQDLTEYTLLIAFVTLCSAALLSMNQAAINTIWTSAENSLEAAAEFSS